MMHRYELSIECLSCRQGRHERCSGKTVAADEVHDAFVDIRCTCAVCNRKGRESK
jgi:hypothetical protein